MKKLRFVDWLRGGLIAAGTAVAGSIFQAVQQGLVNNEHININIGAIGGAAIGGMATYIGYKIKKDPAQDSLNVLQHQGYDVPKNKEDLPKLR